MLVYGGVRNCGGHPQHHWAGESGREYLTRTAGRRRLVIGGRYTVTLTGHDGLLKIAGGAARTGTRAGPAACRDLTVQHIAARRTLLGLEAARIRRNAGLLRADLAEAGPLLRAWLLPTLTAVMAAYETWLRLWLRQLARQERRCGHGTAGGTAA